MKVISETHRVC